MPEGKETTPISMQEHKKLLSKEIKPTREKLQKQQRDQCPLCHRVLKDPCLDHDHQSGAIRAVLCRNCNRVEGKIFFWARLTGKDPVEFVRNLAKYWLKHTENRHGLIHPLHGKPKKRKKRKKK